METSEQKQNKLLGFLTDILRGVAIGIAFIIPGFSGGSVAAILGIYERLVGAIANIFKRFKESILTLLPVLLGMLVGIAALILPIQWGLKNYPIPTVTLFVGLAIGGLPSVTQKLKGGRPAPVHFAAFFIPLIVAAALCFLPNAKEVNLLEPNFGLCLLLVLMGFLGSAALVIPGISGSMLLLIFGFYNPIVHILTDNLLKGLNVGVSLLVLLCLAIGVAVGFFAISVLMKYLLEKHPRGTYFAIFGFILGSIPAVYASTIRESGTILFSNPWYWVVSAALLLVGFAISFTLSYFSKKK